MGGIAGEPVKGLLRGIEFAQDLGTIDRFRIACELVKRGIQRFLLEPQLVQQPRGDRLLMHEFLRVRVHAPSIVYRDGSCGKQQDHDQREAAAQNEKEGAVRDAPREVQCHCVVGSGSAALSVEQIANTPALSWTHRHNPTIPPVRIEALPGQEAIVQSSRTGCGPLGCGVDAVVRLG
jgi:hypothetical protein